MSALFKPSSHILLTLLVGWFVFNGPVIAAEPNAPDNPALIQHKETARGYMRDHQWSYANYEWRAVLAQDPKNPEANVGLAEALLQAGFKLDARLHLEEIRQSVHKLSIELEYAKILEALDSPQEAVAVYQKNLEIVPFESESFNRLTALLPLLPEAERAALKEDLEKRAEKALKVGQEALRNRDYKKAAQYFAIGTAINPTLSDRNDYGVALLLQGNYEEARKQFDFLKHARADQWEFYANAALVALGRDHSAEAVTNLEKAIGLCRDNTKKPLLYNDLGYIYENQSKWQKARNAYEKAIELNPSFTKSKLNLAYAYQKDMAYQSAIQTYQSILAADPQNSQVLNRLGFAYEQANKHRLALQAYQKATMVNPSDQEGYTNMAILYKKMGKSRLADEAYRKMMDIEFRKMEASASQAKETDKTLPERESASASGNPLLNYVDVFFLSPSDNNASRPST